MGCSASKDNANLATAPVQKQKQDESKVDSTENTTAATTAATDAATVTTPTLPSPGQSIPMLAQQDAKSAEPPAIAEVAELVSTTVTTTAAMELSPLPADCEVVFVLGGPGSGKGTQCERIVGKYGFKHLSAGDLLREEVKSGSETGQMCDKLMKDGLLVPVEVTVGLLHKAMVASGSKRFLIDGFPRAMDQAEVFERLIQPCSYVLYFDCTEEEMEKRLIKRGETSGRTDDNIDTIKKRFRTFVEQSKPVIAHYEAQGKCFSISAMQTPDEVFQAVCAAIDSREVKGASEPADGVPSLVVPLPILDPLPGDSEIVFVLGGPGSGKGTQCERIVSKYGFTHLSAGDLLREEVKSGSAVGQMCDAIMKDGKLVPVEVTIGLLHKAMLATGGKRFLIDGFPRAMDQAEVFEKQVKPCSYVLYFDCTEEEMEKRLLKRGETSGRADDNIATIKKRFHTFVEQSKPVIAHYEAQSKCFSISSMQLPDEVFHAVSVAIDSRQATSSPTAPPAIVLPPLDSLPEDSEIVFVLGGPGSGKGTQCERIVGKYGFTHLSAGDLLREEVKSGSIVGHMCKAIMTDGKLVPVEVTIGLLHKAMLATGGKQFLIDGFPRAMDQAEVFEKLVKPCSYVLYFDCNEEEMEKRLLKRGESSGRADDNIATIKKRFHTFVEQSKPVIAHYEALSKCFSINSMQSPADVFMAVCAAIDSKQQTSSAAASSVVSLPPLDPLPEDSEIVFVLGGPGSGKGTQCERIVSKYGFTHLSAGDLLRDEVKSGSDVGQMCDAIMKEGKLVPVEVTIGLLHKTMLTSGGKRFLIDGFPRAMDQAEVFEKLVKPCSYVLYFDCTEEEMEKRLLKRGETSGRADDNIATIKKRFRTFVEQSKPVIAHYEAQSKCFSISSMQLPDEVFHAVSAAIDSKQVGGSHGHSQPDEVACTVPPITQEEVTPAAASATDEGADAAGSSSIEDDATAAAAAEESIVEAAIAAEPEVVACSGQPAFIAAEDTAVVIEHAAVVEEFVAESIVSDAQTAEAEEGAAVVEEFVAESTVSDGQTAEAEEGATPEETAIAEEAAAAAPEENIIALETAAVVEETATVVEDAVIDAPVTATETSAEENVVEAVTTAAEEMFADAEATSESVMTAEPEAAVADTSEPSAEDVTNSAATEIADPAEVASEDEPVTADGAVAVDAADSAAAGTESFALQAEASDKCDGADSNGMILPPHPTIPPPEGPVLVVIMDGYGENEFKDEYNAVHSAKTKCFDHLRREDGRFRTVQAHGTAVGLPSDADMGNSEVGHNALGSGQVICQGARLVDLALETGSIFEGDGWQFISEAFETKTVHFLGLLSDGGVHSRCDQLHKCLRGAAERGAKRIRCHALTDGRDVPDGTSIQFFMELETILAELNEAHGCDAKIASGGGRMNVTMDRYEADWDMVKRGWDAHVLGKAPHTFTNAVYAIEALKSVELGAKSDQYLDAFVITDNQGAPVGTIEDGDAVVLFNFRADRMVEISKAFEYEDFSAFDRERYPQDLRFAGMMQYDGDLKLPTNYLVPPPEIHGVSGQYLVKNGISTFACSETQKFGHVTFFWNGNRSGYVDKSLETYLEIPSDNVPFNQAPAMKAQEITEAGIAALRSGKYKMIRINYANPDMVGHTGDLTASRIAVEVVDACLSDLLKVCDEVNGRWLVTADHGNADDMVQRNKNGKPLKDAGGNPLPLTSHTLAPVPVAIGGLGLPDDVCFRDDLPQAGLANITGTFINLLGLQAPSFYEPSLI